MVFLLLSFVFATEVMVVIPDTFTCDSDTENKLKVLVSHIRENFRTQNVRPHVNKLELTIEKCKIDSGKFGFGRGIYDFWRQPSYHTEFLDKFRETFEASYFRNIDDDIEELQELMKLGGKRYSLKMLQEAQERGKSHITRCSKPVNVDVTALGAVRDQDSVGWCYAFTAADLISHKTGKRISAADIAIKYNDGSISRFLKKYIPNFGDTNLKGGYIDLAIDKTKSTGACLEESFRSDDNGTGSLEYYLGKIQTESRANACIHTAAHVFGNIKTDELSEILSHTAKEDVIIELAKKSCEPRIDISNLKVAEKRVHRQNKMEAIADIDRQLESGNIVGVSYFASILRDKDDIDPKTSHASSIINRRFNPASGQCEYLIRNSHGRSCMSYYSGYDCKEGNIWLPQEQLLKAVRGITYVE